MKIPFSDLEFRPLTDSIDISSFHCDDQDLDEFLQDDALENQKARLSVTRVALWQGTVVGYFTLVNDCIVRKGLNSGDGEDNYRYPHYPALKIARLATDKDHERRGIGRSMLLKTAIIAIRLSQHVGCRLITVDSKKQSVGFYTKYGFQIATVQERQNSVALYRDFHRATMETDAGINPTLDTFGSR